MCLALYLDNVRGHRVYRIVFWKTELHRQGMFVYDGLQPLEALLVFGMIHRLCEQQEGHSTWKRRWREINNL
jgi:hypothetical protein